MEVTCGYCGKTFEAKNRLQKYCCMKCKTSYYAKARKENPDHYTEPIQPCTCEICGKVFTPTNRNQQKYCSKECRALAIRRYNRRLRIENFAAAMNMPMAAAMENLPEQPPCKPKAPFYNPREVYGYRKITVTEGVDGYFSDKWVEIDRDLPWYQKHTSTLMYDEYPC